MNIEIIKYLNRIQAVKKDMLDFEYLVHLQKQHVLNVHFENLDILNKKPLSLNTEDLYKKIVLFQRGGVCYELNGLFYHLLTQLGFNPYLMAGTVHVRDEIWAIENAHLFMVVPVDNKEYLVDVGLGGKCPRIPVPMSGEEVIDSDGNYRVKKDEEKLLFYLQKETSTGWEILYRFEAPLNKWTIDSIYPICVLTETSPQSIFNKDYFLSRVTEEGRITLLGNTLIIVKGKEIIKEKLANHKIVEEAQRYFQLNI
ncbi:acetyltransferase [Peribacillus asahii]|uniref:Acetyltransferase n=1 Tax=Peribacillus asahii TaxID=228899 RepID=A0A3T0KLB5_9BACI|nr:arylamine N-acetyltransferase [Peribacillus asahii]AZV41156.1 acetyltransferase [Peribacillus asahii]